MPSGCLYTALNCNAGPHCKTILSFTCGFKALSQHAQPIVSLKQHTVAQAQGINTGAALQIKEAALELGYQADETFCLKISQLREIFVVRWSVFLLGPAGCGKSAIWKTLMRAQQNFGEKTFFKPINPKVTDLLQTSNFAFA